MAEAKEAPDQQNSKSGGDSSADSKRKAVPGDFSYTATPGRLKSALQAMTLADRPDQVTKDFVSAYLGVSGGSGAPIPGILRKVGFIGSDNRPTDLYAKFQSEGSRPGAALEGLRRGFPEIFKRHTYAHTLDESKIKDILVEITGRTKADPVVSQIYGTFDALRSFIPNGFQGTNEAPASQDPEKGRDRRDQEEGDDGIPPNRRLGLSYHINIVLPETKDISVFNAIFQSLKQNLLQ